jgi:TonB family protein
MNKILIGLVILLGFGLNQTLAQRSSKIDTIFFNAGGNICFNEDATTIRIRQIGDTIYIKDYIVKTGKLEMEGAFLDLQGRQRVGKFVGYHENGQVRYQKYYEQFKLQGNYVEFHKNGKKLIEGQYFQGNKKGEWREYDSLENLYALDNYVKDKLSGESFTYYPGGQLKRKEFYVDGEAEEKQCFTLDGKDTTYFPRFEMPNFPGGEEELYKFLAKNIQYPGQAREKGIEGKVILNFVVSTEGVLEDITIVYSPDELFSKESLRVIKAMPNWTPGKEEGKIVRVKFTLPIRFKLN